MLLVLHGETGKDLNKVSETELQAAKDVMETTYLKHKKDPGDTDYVYDLRVSLM